MNWPTAVFGLGIIFMVVFNGQIKSILLNVRSIKKSGLEIDAPSRQKEQEEEIAATDEGFRELLKERDLSPTTKRQKEILLAELEQRGMAPLSEINEFLLTRLAECQVINSFENIYQLIAGPQIRLLEFVNQSHGAGKTNEDFNHGLNRQFQEALKLFSDWPIADFKNFIFGVGLVEEGDGVVRLTDYGAEFLSWLTRAGKNLRR